MVFVLVVDDDVAIGDFLKEILQDEGYTIELAGDGHEALDVIQQTLPALVVSDVMMPRMDGITLLSILKSNTGTAHIPVLLMTAGQLNGSRVSDAAAIIRKPFDIDHLLSLIQQHLASG